jgi:hypothetical protein
LEEQLGFKGRLAQFTIIPPLRDIIAGDKVVGSEKWLEIRNKQRVFAIIILICGQYMFGVAWMKKEIMVDAFQFLGALVSILFLELFKISR